MAEKGNITPEFGRSGVSINDMINYRIQTTQTHHKRKDIEPFEPGKQEDKEPQSPPDTSHTLKTADGRFDNMFTYTRF